MLPSRVAIAAAAALVIAAPASAATVTRAFLSSLTFANGAPATDVTLRYTLTFDPAVGAINAAVDSFSSSSALSSFSVPAQYTSSSGGDVGLTNISVGGAPAGAGTTLFAIDDFVVRFTVLSLDGTPADGALSAVVSNASYVFSGTNYQATRAITVLDPAASAAPEPATWAAMLLGFGLIGASLRRGRRPVPA